MHATTARNSAIFSDRSNNPDFAKQTNEVNTSHHKNNRIVNLISYGNAKPQEERNIDEIRQRVDVDEKNACEAVA